VSAEQFSDFAALILVAVGVAGLVLQQPGGSVLVCIAAARIMAGLLMLWAIDDRTPRERVRTG